MSWDGTFWSRPFRRVSHDLVLVHSRGAENLSFHFRRIVFESNRRWKAISAYDRWASMNYQPPGNGYPADIAIGCQSHDRVSDLPWPSSTEQLSKCSLQFELHPCPLPPAELRPRCTSCHPPRQHLLPLSGPLRAQFVERTQIK